LNLQKKKTSLEGIRQSQDEVRKELKSKEEKSNQEVEAQFAKLKEFLEKRRLEIHAQVKEHYQKQDKEICLKAEEIDNLNKKIKDFLTGISEHFPNFEEVKENKEKKEKYNHFNMREIWMLELSCNQIEIIIKAFQLREKMILESFPVFFPKFIEATYEFPQGITEVLQNYGFPKLSISGSTKFIQKNLEFQADLLPAEISKFDEKESLCYSHFSPYKIYSKNSEIPFAQTLYLLKQKMTQRNAMKSWFTTIKKKP